MDAQHIGTAGEAHAAAHFERLGYRILARGYRTRFGELDLVAASGDTVVFVEVKARRGGDPWASLHDAKRRRVRRMAAAWLTSSPDARGYFAELRFDAVGVTLDAQGGLLALEHLENAF